MQLQKLWIASAIMLSSWSAAYSADLRQRDLIPRQDFFGNPTRSLVTVSPDGRWIAYLAPREGVLNIWLAPFGKLESARPLTQDKKRGIRSYTWAASSEQILYSQDNDGDENYRVYSLDVASAQVKPLTPAGKIRADLLYISRKEKHDILVQMNDRDPQFFDVYRINLKSGDRKLIFKNEGFENLVPDEKLNIRIATKPTPNGGFELHKVGLDGKVDAKPLLTVANEDALTTGVLRLDQSGEFLYLVDSRGRDKAALAQIDLKTGKLETLISGKKADIDAGYIIDDPITYKPRAVAENYLKPEWTAIDPKIQPDLDFLKRETHGMWNLTSQTDDGKYWVLSIDRVTEPYAFYIYDTKAKRLNRLFSTRPELEGKQLAPMHGVEIEARDGTILPSYLSLPADTDSDGDGKPAKPLPMVLFVHGGPWARDEFGYDAYHQWLASRGLAVLSVNYRGSTGFGKEFINKSSKEFAGAMHHDLIDAVNWAVKQGIAQKDKVGIMGGSYGGYATLVGMTFTPDTFACGVDIVGPSNLVTLVESFPAYWKPFLESTWYKRVGNPSKEDERKDLLARSPITKVHQIKRPLLIGQGANDPRVTQKESDQIVSAMKAKNIPVTYALYPDEGHGFALPQNRVSFNSITENFFAKCLGSVAQPIGQDLVGSSLQIPEGREYISGLKEALEAKKK